MGKKENVSFITPYTVYSNNLKHLGENIRDYLYDNDLEKNLSNKIQKI